MCGRYIVIEDDDIAGLRGLVPAVQSYLGAGEPDGRLALPGTDCPILTQHGDLMNARWGFAKWDGKGVVFNARAETLASSGFFAPHLSYGRCIAPARMYFEWADETPDDPKAKPKKRKYRVFSVSGRPLWLCALMRPGKNAPFEYTVVTKSAAPNLTFLHPRMPLILDDDGAKRWLDRFDPSVLRYESVPVRCEADSPEPYAG